jgi:hypothetical protein
VAGLDAELVDERGAGVPVALERFGLAARAVQREHQLRAEPLVQRVVGDETLQLADELGVAAEGEVGVDAGLERREPQLVQARDLGLQRLLGRQVGERRAAPQRERGAQERGGVLDAAGRRGRAGVGDALLEALEVELARGDAQEVAGAARLEDAARGGLEQLAQRDDVHLQRLERTVGRGLAPQRVDQPVAGDNLVGG